MIGAVAGMERNRYLDLLRVVAIGGVVYGHWLLVDITYRHGRLTCEGQKSRRIGICGPAADRARPGRWLLGDDEWLSLTA